MADRTARSCGRPNATRQGEVDAVPSLAMRVVIVSDPRELAAHVPEWQVLSEELLEANAFFEPGVLLPALNTLRAGEDVRVVLIYGSEREQLRLCGLFPIERRRWSPLPVRTISLWCHRHCYLGAPLLHRNVAAPALEAFLDWVVMQPAALFEWSWLPGAGPFHELLTSSLNHRGLPFFTSNRYERALFQQTSGQAAATHNEPAHPRLQRLRRRLEEVGPLSVTSPVGEAEVTAWIDEFLCLEKQGWKGSAGTALDCSPQDRDFFRASVVEAFRRQRLLALTLRCGVRTIAMRCSFCSGDGAFAFKTCYDATLAHYSPGAILELETMRDLQRRPELAWMDSCTTCDNELLNRLWKQRRPIETCLMATGRKPGRWLISVLSWIRRIRRRLPSWHTSRSCTIGTPLKEKWQ